MSTKDQRILDVLNQDQRKALRWIGRDMSWTVYSPTYDTTAPASDVLNTLIMYEPALVIADEGQLLHQLSAVGVRVRTLMK